MGQKYWYTVMVGKDVGVFTDWLHAKPIVFQTNLKKYESEEEACKAFDEAHENGFVKLKDPFKPSDGYISRRIYPNSEPQTRSNSSAPLPFVNPTCSSSTYTQCHPDSTNRTPKREKGGSYERSGRTSQSPEQATPKGTASSSTRRPETPTRPHGQRSRRQPAATSPSTPKRTGNQREYKIVPPTDLSEESGSDDSGPVAPRTPSPTTERKMGATRTQSVPSAQSVSRTGRAFSADPFSRAHSMPNDWSSAHTSGPVAKAASPPVQPGPQRTEVRDLSDVDSYPSDSDTESESSGPEDVTPFRGALSPLSSPKIKNSISSPPNTPTKSCRRAANGSPRPVSQHISVGVGTSPKVCSYCGQSAPPTPSVALPLTKPSPTRREVLSSSSLPVLLPSLEQSGSFPPGADPRSPVQRSRAWTAPNSLSLGRPSPNYFASSAIPSGQSTLLFFPEKKSENTNT